MNSLVKAFVSQIRHQSGYLSLIHHAMLLCDSKNDLSCVSMPPLVSHRRACGAPTSLHTRQIAVDATFLRLPTGDIHLLSACNAPDECAEEAVRPAGGGPPSPVLSPSWRVARRRVNCPDSTHTEFLQFLSPGSPLSHTVQRYNGPTRECNETADSQGQSLQPVQPEVLWLC